MNEEDTNAPKSFPTARVIAALALAAAVLVVVLGPTGQWVTRALDWIDGMGPWGGVVFVLGYIVATVLFIPGSLLTVGAGFVFGPIWGTVAVSAGSTLGALAAFGIGRHLAGDWVRQRIEGRPRLAATIRAVENDALKVVLLLRLVPLFPFNLLNYSLGLTKITWRRFALAAGSLTRALSGDQAPDSLQLGMWAVGAVALVVAVGFIARRARAELEAHSDVASQPDEKLPHD